MILFCYFLLSFFSLYSLTVEEKVGQLLMVHFHGETANDDAKTLIQDLHVGGFIYYNWANNLSDPQQVKNLSASLQSLSKIPLLIAVDQEGGVVNRVKGLTVFPGNMALGMSENTNLAEEAAFVMGEELLRVGVNLNLAPVVDVNSNPNNPVIGIRSFGNTPEKVVAFGAKALKGYSKAGVLTSLKHYPGYGDVAVDPHEALPILKKSLSELEKEELVPFAKLNSRADTIMTAHILIPELDPERCATVSAKCLGYLRDTLHFKGVIIADSLVMEGVLNDRIENVAIEAFNAGCDILLLGGKLLGGLGHELTLEDVKNVHAALVQAVKEGKISEKRLDNAVKRILTLKKKIKTKSNLSLRMVNTPERRQLARTIAKQAIKVTQNGPKPSLRRKKVALVAPKIMEEDLKNSSFMKLGPLFIDGNVEEISKNHDSIIYFSYNDWKKPKKISNLPLIVIVLRDPQDEELFPLSPLIIKTYSPTLPSLEEAYLRLTI